MDHTQANADGRKKPGTAATDNTAQKHYLTVYSEGKINDAAILPAKTENIGLTNGNIKVTNSFTLQTY
jgi:hypothetical protein